MRRLVTWMLVVAVVVLAVQDRRRAREMKELQGQRKWIVEAKERWEDWREAEELADGEKDVMRGRLEQLREALRMEWEGEDEEGETRRRETRGVAEIQTDTP